MMFTDHLKEKLNFDVEDFCKLSTDDLRCQVDFAINQVKNILINVKIESFKNKNDSP